MDVTVSTSHGSATITGTAHHLYWDATTRSWTPADQLRLGDHLQSTNGATTTIVALRDYTTSTVTYNLTINNLHTYYVLASATPILVHNSNGCVVTIPSGKWDYLFGRVTEGSHNAPRSAQNRAQLARIGIHDTPEGRQLMVDFFNSQFFTDDNVIKEWTNQYGTYQTRDGILVGPGGYLQVQSTWDIGGESPRLTTIIPMGGS
jgi:hypothetical protein